MKIINFFFSCIVLFFTISFAVSNKAMFTFTLWPLPYEMTLPISIIVLGFALLFFIFGGAYSWILTLPVRNARYLQSRKIRELEKKIEIFEEQKSQN